MLSITGPVNLVAYRLLDRPTHQRFEDACTNLNKRKTWRYVAVVVAFTCEGRDRSRALSSTLRVERRENAYGARMDADLFLHVKVPTVYSGESSRIMAAGSRTGGQDAASALEEL